MVQWKCCAAHRYFVVFPFRSKCIPESIRLPSPGRIPFAFLDDIRTRFLRTYGRVVQTALAYAMWGLLLPPLQRPLFSDIRFGEWQE